MGRNRNQDNGPGTAPYNFVPLNQRIVRAVKRAEQLPDHDTYADGNYGFSGHIDVELETLSPVYTRAPYTEAQLAERNRRDRDEDDTENRDLPEFFHLGDPARPVIPGSSLRGMLRSLVEVVTYGKMGSITNKNLFFRTVDNSVIGLAYRDRMVGKENGEKKVETGFLRFDKTTKQYEIHVCEMLRVDKRQLPNEHIKGGERNPNAIPNWRYQNKVIGVHVSSTKGYLVDSVDMTGKSGRPGVLVMSGNSPKKKKEFVFFPPASDAEVIEVSDELMDQFHDDDQITQWQGKAFPKDEPSKNARERNGMLQSRPQESGDHDYGDPVFFLREPTRTSKTPVLSFLGRAQMFRLPYINSPYDLLPDEHKYAAVYDVKRDRVVELIDFAEAMFGYVREDGAFFYPEGGPHKPKQGDKQRAYAGRVFISDAEPVEAVRFYKGAKGDKTIVPKVLSTPKPTSFQKYLDQPTDNAKKMRHYDSNGASIRGHKGYWHHGSQPDIEDPKPNEMPRQKTQMQPVDANNRFRFRIRFDALSDIELGALLWAITLPGKKNTTYAHKIGMGKGIGLGSVKLTPRLTLIDRDGRLNGTSRYSQLFAVDTDGAASWYTAEADYTELIPSVARDFERFVLGKIGAEENRLYKVPRIAALMSLLKWRGDLSGDELARIADEGLAKGRRRLPDAGEVFKD